MKTEPPIDLIEFVKVVARYDDAELRDLAYRLHIPTVIERPLVCEIAKEIVKSLQVKETCKENPSEISVVDKAALRQALDFLDQGFTQWREEKELFIAAARAYLATPVPLSGKISLADMIDVYAKAAKSGHNLRDTIAIVLKAAKVKYHE